MFTGRFSAAILATPFTGFGRQRQLAVEFSGSVGIRQVSTPCDLWRPTAFGFADWRLSVRAGNTVARSRRPVPVALYRDVNTCGATTSNTP